MTNPLDNIEVSYKIIYQDHALELQTAEDRRGNDSYVREHQGTIEAEYFDDDHEEGETETAGFIDYSIVKVGLLGTGVSRWPPDRH